MSNIIRIKRRAYGNAAGAPSSLENAELAYNEQDNTLYYGWGTGGLGGTATQVIPIAGTGAYVDRTTAQSIDGVKTFVQQIHGNIDTADKLKTARTITITGDADSPAVSFDGSSNIALNVTFDTVNANVGSFGSTTKIPYFTVNGKGLVTAAGEVDVATILNIAGDSGTDGVSLLSETLSFVGGEGIDTAVTNNTVTISAEDATYLNKGVASFDNTQFTVTSGAVSIKSITLGTSTLVNGSTVTDLLGLTRLTVDNVDINGNTISTTDTNGDLVLAPNGTGNVNVDNSRIVNLADPVSAQDAATKAFVENLVQGLDPKQSVKAATTGNLAALSGLLTIDDIVLVAGDRVLVKDQTTSSQNGIYIAATNGWTRSLDANTWDELVSAYVFVEAGTVNYDNGFLCTINNGGTLDSSPVTWVQFNGAGQVIAGDGLSKTGNRLDVVAGTGITVAADNVALTGQALALHNLATNGFFVRTGTNTVAARSVAVNGFGLAITNGDGVAGNPTISLDSTLAALSQVDFAANTMVYATAADTFSTTVITPFARTLMDDTDAATMRSTLGLGTMAVQNANSVAITGGAISNLTTFDNNVVDGGTF